MIYENVSLELRFRFKRKKSKSQTKELSLSSKKIDSLVKTCLKTILTLEIQGFEMHGISK